MTIVLIHSAIIFATKAHNGQKRKGTDLPYIIHPLEVIQILSSVSASEDVLIAGVLHDVLEDTKITYDTLVKTFGKDIAQIVKECTASKTSTWIIQKEKTIDKLRNTSTNTAMVLCADKLSNLRSIIYDLSQESENFWNRFSERKEKVIWYYNELGIAISQRCDLPICLKQEYKGLLNKLNNY